jgi:hypothetical protein
MRLFFLLLLVVLLRSNSNALQCIKPIAPIIFTAVNVTNAIEFVDQLETIEEDGVCRVSYKFSYSENYFMVIFGIDYSQIHGDVNMDVYLDMKYYMASGTDVYYPGTGYKKLYFKCNDEDACERHFWRNHFESFVKEDSIILKEAFHSTLITEIQEKGKIHLIN